MAFVEFLESQEPIIASATASLFGFRNRIRTARRRLVSIGMSALVVGAALYVVLADPSFTVSVLPREVPYPMVHAGLVLLLVFLILSLVQHVRRLGGEE